MTFDMLNRKIQTLLKEKGFVEETQAQRQAIKEILDGKNILLVAPTGTGKTEAVFLPILDKILEKERKRVFCLYITPLRSLNRDLMNRLTYWGDKLEIDIEIRHGDTSQRIRSQQASDPPHVLITTPETLQSLIFGRKIKEHLRNVKCVIIDEVHEIFGTKRGVQLSVALERLKRLTGEDFQRIGLSATIADKEKIARFIQGSSRKVDIKEVKQKKDMKILVEWPEVKAEDYQASERLSVSPEAFSRIRRIIEIVESKKSSLIFINTRMGAEILSSQLKTLKNEISVHHSSLSKESRIKTETGLKAKDIPAVVSTSSLALGIDIGSIDTVIQYMSPRRVELFLQKVGRSGHTVSRTPEGVIIAVDEDDAIESAAIGNKALAVQLEPVLEKSNSFDVLAHQIAGMALAKEIKIGEAFEIVKRAEPYHNLTIEEFREVLTLVQTLRIVRVVDEILRPGRNIFAYYFSNLSMIPDSKTHDVVNFETKEKIATVDEDFVSDLDIGDNFICRGSYWSVVSKEDKIYVSPSKSAFNAPEWSGELMPVDFTVAQEVGKIKQEVYSRERGDAIAWLKTNYPVDDKSAKEIVDDVKNLGVSPAPNKIVIESIKDYVILHAYFGNKVNETLGKTIASFLVLKYGKDIGSKSDQYRIIFKLPEKNQGELLKTVLASIDPSKIESSLRIILKGTPMFKHRFIHTAKRMGIIARGANISKIGVKKLIEMYAGTVVFEEAMKDVFDEKLDIGKTKEIVGSVKDGAVSIEISPGWSEFSSRFLRSYAPEVVKPERPESEIIELVKERLENKRVTLACFYCKDWIESYLVKNAAASCPKCGSKLLGMVYPEDIEALKAKKKTPEQQKWLLRARKSADLYLSHGKQALLALAAHGVGPETAKRVLRKSEGEAEFIRNIIEAEKLYSKTRIFWDARLRERRL